MLVRSAGPQSFVANCDVLKVSFGQSGNAASFKGAGWHGPDGEFSWARGRTSALRFRAPFDVDIVGIAIDLAPMLWLSEGISHQAFSVRLAGHEVLTETVGRRMRFEVPIPPLAYDAGQTIEVQVVHPVAIRPCDVNPASSDDRPLSVALFGFSLFYRARDVSAAAIVQAALLGSQSACEMAIDRMWSEQAVPSGGYRIEVSEQNLGPVVACCTPSLRMEKGKIVITPAEPLHLAIPFACLSGSLSARLSISADDRVDIADLEGLRPIVDGVPARPALARGDEAFAWELADVHCKPYLPVMLVWPEGKVNESGSLAIDRYIVTFTHDGPTLRSADEALFWRSIDALTTPETADQAEMMINAVGHCLVNTTRLLDTIARIARLKCDASLEMRALLVAYLRGHSDGVELATRARSQGRPLTSAMVLEARLRSQPTHIRAFYELGFAYRGVGWFARAMKAFNNVPDPHPHWAGVILWNRRKLVETRQAALAILCGRAGRLEDRYAAELVGHLLSLSRPRAARRLLAQYFDPGGAEWSSRSAQIDIFEHGAAAIARLAAVAVQCLTDATPDIKKLSRSLRWMLTEAGRYDLASQALLEDYRKNHDVSALANATIASCLAAQHDSVTKEWSTYKPADLLETYEAQIFISLAINDRESPQVRLITHQFDDVVPLPTQKNIIQFWDDNTPPEDVQDCIQSWRDLNPSYNHILYSDEAARAFIDKEFGARFARCYDMCHHPAMKSDLLRMLALYYHGGIYFDADLVCIRSLERTLVRDLIGTPGLITIPVVPSFPYAINNDIVSAAKGSPFMIRIAERAATRIEEDYNAGIVSDVGQVTGPGLYTRSIASEILAGSQRGALTEGAERYIIIPFSYRNIMLRSRGDLQYFRTRSHWSVAQQNRK